MEKTQKKYSASYTNLNPNFCISNIRINENTVSEKDKSIIAVIRNVINRGVLSSPSLYLREMLGNGRRYPNPAYLYETDKNTWDKTIKGSIETNPALEFYEKYLLKLLNNDIALFNSFIPELPIKDVLMVEDNLTIGNMYLDFYSPLLQCNIEIDGIQHKEQKNTLSDIERDKILRLHGIKVIRIKTTDIDKPCLELKALVNKVSLDNFVVNKKEKQLDNYGAAIRYQMLLLDLLENGYISLNDEVWNFNIIQNENIDSQVFEYSARDIILFADKLRILQEEPKTNIEIKTAISNINFNNDMGIKINLNLYSKYDDLNMDKDVIYIRNDYFLYDVEASVCYQKKVPLFSKFKNYYTVSNAKVFYKLKQIDEDKRESLNYFLKNLFHFDKFLPKQEEIVFECLRNGSVIGLLPTGAGKSLCYQLTSLMLPGTTLVISPLKILMKDQYENMVGRHGISNICYINSSNKGATDIVKNNQSKICLISPERFFNEEFLTILKDENINVSMVTVDEVHCLSEWGHDFRTSYLCLSHYLRENLDKSCHLMGLTATASPRVCEDVEIEFANFKGYTKIIQSSSLARTNLNLEVENFIFNEKYNTDKNPKYQKLLKECTLEDIENKTIVFTRTKSPKKSVPSSCFNLASSVKADIKNIEEKVDYFAGSSDVPEDENENDLKLQNFKSGKTTLLFSTKAFGMGVDIPDIRKTIHYEIPSSLESLYQEFGRAGRDGENSICKIWFYKERESAIRGLFNGNFTIKNVKAYQSSFKEIQTNLYFLTTGNLDTREELFFENYLFDYLKKEQETNGLINFTADDFIDDFHQTIGYEEIYNDRGYLEEIKVFEEYEDKVSPEFNYKNFIDKALYRLYLIGKISMWGVRYSANLNNPIYVNISILTSTIETQKNRLVNYIQKYEPLYVYDKEMSEDKILSELISWAFNHFVYQRLQSIKNIYEACEEYENSEQFMNMIVSYLAREEENESLLTNPADYSVWFKMLKEKSLIELKSIIARYLESDDKLVSLNFISGVIRLLMDDYDNADGERRLKMAFEEISNFDVKDIKNIIKLLFDVVSSEKYRDVLVSSILDVNTSLAEYLYEEYQNEEIESVIVYSIAKKLCNVGGKINDKYRKN